VIWSLVNGVSYGRGNSATDRILDPTKIDILERIGAGVFGQTYLASYKGNRVVVKIPHHGTGDLQELIAYIRMEPHPNVVRFYGITTKKEKLCPVTKYYNLASADKLLAKGLVNFRNPSWFFKIALDIAEGLRSCS